ncbi:uncharacterized protein B0H64DRAFT_473261 [Chaetomium fimeti]|uniref:Amidoligase enzyme n=1 Tax=Chaetomium fimeti TaxID=1854472 RepID=A0AAE0LUB5_9PEZI|nr:hypothetical protein B0H64DRAFT_473261 [Chaetomium fimeti]
MSTTATVRPHFNFEVEIELLVKPKEGNTKLYRDLKASGFDPALKPGHDADKKKAERNRTEIRKALAAALTVCDVEAKIDGASYETWYVKEEGSLSEVADERGGGYWAIKLVSKIMSTDEENWADDLENVFQVVLTNFDVLLTKGCSMHVHVAPGPKWNVTSLRNFMKATGVFDDAITKIMPAERKKNPWARSNFHDGPGPADKAQPALKKAFDEVPSKAWKPLFAVFDKIEMTNVLLTWGQVREVSWNLASLHKSETVEFRRPPGVKTAAAAQKWATFAVAFVCAGTQSDWQAPWLLNKRSATVGELQSFVSSGLELLGWEHLLDTRELTENTSSAMPLEHFDWEGVKRKLGES